MSADRVTPLLLRATRLELQAARRLAARIALLDALRECIHALQRERSASSIYLASGGARCAGERLAVMDAGAAPLDNLQALLAAQGTQSPEDDRADAGVDATMLRLMAGVLLGLQGLGALRAAIAAQHIGAQDASAAFSVCIAALLQLLAHLADAGLLPGVPGVSRLLAALLQLAQGKEAAAQEGAAGTHLFAAGQCDADAQEHMAQLIEAQEHDLAALAGCEAALVRQLRTECARHAQQVQQQDPEGLLRRLREPPPAAQPLAGDMQALHELLHTQSERLARTEVELQTVRRALSERKVIERAKGVLMARLGLSEEAAFRALQKASMDQNRRLPDMAEATLALADLAFAPAKKH